jgi:hypothetical protein
MASIDKSISDLQRQLGRADQEPSEAYLQLKAVIIELSGLKASAAVHYRAGRRVEGENIPRRVLGPGYTHADLFALAVERCVAEGKVSAERSAACFGVLRERWERDGKDPDAAVEWERNVS